MKPRIIVATHQPNRSELSIRQEGMIRELDNLIEDMRDEGLVVTIETVPHTPPRMGSYDTLIDVRKAMDHKALAAERGGYKLAQHNHATPLMPKTKSA